MMLMGEQGVRLNLIQRWDMNELCGGWVDQGETQRRPFVTFKKKLGFVPQPNLPGSSDFHL